MAESSSGAGATGAAAAGGPYQQPKMPANPYAKHLSPRRTVSNPYAPRIYTSTSTSAVADRSAVSGTSSSTSSAPLASCSPSAAAAVPSATFQHPDSNHVSHARCNRTSRAHLVSNPYAKSPTTPAAAASAYSSSSSSRSTHGPTSTIVQSPASSVTQERPPSEALSRTATVDQSSKSPSSSEAHAPKVCCKIDKKKLKELVEMGFDKDEAKDALLRYDNDLLRAATFLGNQLSQHVPDVYDRGEEEDTGGNTVNGMRVIDACSNTSRHTNPNEIKTAQNRSRSRMTARKVTPPGNATAAKESCTTCSTSPATSTSAKRSLDFSPRAKRPPTKKTMTAPMFENNSSLSSNRRISIRNTSNPYAKGRSETEPEPEPKVPSNDSIDIDPNKTYVLYFDGASKGNPGEAGAGMVLYEDKNENKNGEIWSGYLYLDGDKTNNEAEYHGVLNGMQCADLLGVKKIVVKGDSKLVINHLKGDWQCRNPRLRQLYAASGETQQGFECFSIYHVGRNFNKRADELANIAVRTKSSNLGPADFFRTPNPSQVEEQYGVSNKDEAATLPKKEEMEIEALGDRASAEDDAGKPAVESMEVDGAPTRLIDQEDELCTALFSQSISSDEDEDGSWAKELPFIVQYELIRFKERNGIATSGFGAGLKLIFDANQGQSSLPVELISYIYAEKEGHAAPYESVMKAASIHGDSVDSSVTCLITFSALLDKEGVRLLPPEPIGLTTRRIYRQFGSHRFLELRCSDKANLDICDIKSHLEEKISIGGRKYGLLYSKPSEKTQVYRLFAERGPGISPKEEMTTPQVAKRCIPLGLNPTICLSRYMKRMKLVFTDTTPSLTLKACMLQRVEDIMSPENREMTDGCGLVSREAIDLIYSHYQHYREERNRYVEGIPVGSRSTPMMQRCPYSSFQGRLGGMKGMWIVDDRLGHGIIVQYRPSQLKYEVPFTADNFDSCDFDSSFNMFYHTVEIKTWDTPPPPANLSRDAVQILEDRGVPKEYFLSLARKEIEELEALRSDSTRLLRRYKARTSLKDSHSVFDDDMLLRMLTASVPLDEPVMQKKINDFIDKELTCFKEKARFLVERSRYLRMFPDHTGLLEEDECFVALGDAQQYDIERSSSVVAMRLPSYFRGDLRKLKLVPKHQLMQRCPERGRFFQGIITGLILSTKGNLSQAEQMSGGDFDGDGAWCCWDEEVVRHVTDCLPSKSFLLDAPRDGFKGTGKEKKWCEPEFSREIIRFTWYHRQDTVWLSKLCANLSILRDHSFDRTDEIASKAFLAVDNPYVCQWTDQDDSNFRKLPQPHWYAGTKTAGSTYAKIYHSKKVLGLLHDLLREAGKERRLVIEEQMNIHIQREIERAQKRANDPTEIDRIRDEMLSRLKNFNQALRAKIDSSERDDEVGKKMNNKEIAELYKAHRKEIDSKYDKNERPMAFAILYEQTYFQSRERMLRYNSVPYIFAWALGLDHLSRIIADGEAEIEGYGLAPTVARGREQVIFGKKR